MHRLTIPTCLLLALIALAINHVKFDEKYVSKSEVIRTLIAYSRATQRCGDQVMKEFNVFSCPNYEVHEFLGFKFVRELSASLNDLLPNIYLYNIYTQYVEKKCVHNFLITR